MSGSRRVAWLGLVLVASAGCVTRSQFDRLRIEHESLKTDHTELEKLVQRRDQEVGELRGQLALANDEKDLARQDLDQASARSSLLEEELRKIRADMTSFPGVEIWRTADGIAFRLKDEILFDSGSHVIKQQGKSALAAVCREIQQGRFSEVRIDGHTDNDPVTRTKEIYPLGNHELAMRRALSVYEYMVTEARVPSSQLILAAYGPNRPAEAGNTEKAKARNRRVEIHVRSTAGT